MHILVVEDDLELCQIIEKSLIEDHYTVEVCHDGADALELIFQTSYDLILLDCMLPSKDGVTILKELRTKQMNVPVMLVTALDQVDDKINGLDAGADDYLAKPFAMKELLARVRALLRRPRTTEQTNQISLHSLKLDCNTLELDGDLSSLTLSKKEGALLEFLMRNPNQTLSKDQIITRIWGFDSDITEGNIDNYIYFLRRRLKTVDSHTKIKTVYGMGYRIETTNE